MSYEQEPPFCIQVEPTEGCSLRCSFCGINGIRGKKRDFKFMTLKTASRLAEEIARLGWNSRLEFAMHGEPTLNLLLVQILREFRERLPRSYMMMESNGTGIHQDPMHSLFELLKYLDCVALDQYRDIEHVPKIRRFLSSTAEVWRVSNKVALDTYLRSAVNKPLKVYEYPQEKDGNPHRRVTNQRRITLISPIDTAKSGTHATLNNHTGCGSPPNDSGVGKRCAKPFRELSVRCDGNVAICCNDWRGVLYVGNINETPLDEIWHSEVMESARRMLVRGRREFAPCRGCDATSHRVGLLPDKKGKETLPEPTQEDIKRLNVIRPTITLPVWRAWEK